MSKIWEMNEADKIFTCHIKRLTDAELSSAFPEMKSLLPTKINELRREKRLVEKQVQEQVKIVDESSDDDFTRWFWRKWIDITTGKELPRINKDIARLKRQLRVAKGIPTPRGSITDDLIAQAREVPVESLLDQKLRRRGRGLVGLCPFHDEKTPSLYVYVEQNRAWCFGCNRGGNPIDVLMLKEGVSFRQAVTTLTGLGYER